MQHRDSSNDFLFAKLHGQWANAVKGAALDKLVRSGTPEMLVRNLHAIGIDGSSRKTFHYELVRREVNALEKIAVNLDRSSARYYKALMMRECMNNLKYLIHCHYSQNSEEMQNVTLIRLPGMPEVDVKKVSETKTVEDFIAAIPISTAGKFQGSIDEVIRQLYQDNDLMLAEGSLDQIYHRHLQEAIAGLPLGMCSAARELADMEIDSRNICMLLRNMRTYHLPPERMDKLWLAGRNSIPGKKLNDLCGSGSTRRAIEMLPGIYSRALLPLSERELYLLENRLWTLLYDTALKLFRDFDTPSRTVVAYPYIQHIETLNIRRVYEAVHFEIPPREIAEMMIGNLP